ncbi:DUF5688 family protein [Anaerocolumna sp. MB42-C2]|uniref:DUF5688 family protein n=1 Tax=Anaerocolumna sp. MB42-C2 TaxID=3070997 RepID=UPI0027DF1FF8|nr:DUF5688 family protein [Anaerocolumna sp. MB42-C2]WMJ88574.1 DUF5688 family protein [Anaerocolumna sp. MB42-C2]
MTNKETFELTGFQEFLAFMKTSVKKEIGEDYQVEINHVIKNNSIELDGLIIKKKEEYLTPNIYMNAYYERYINGEPINKLADEIICIYRNSREKGDREAANICFEFNKMKSCIIYRLINYDKNRKILNSIPHIRFMDLAISFHCLVKNNENGICTIRITNEHIKNWNITLEDLKNAARINTPILFPTVIKSMDEVILELINNELPEESSPDGIKNRNLLEQNEMPSTNNMFVVSNRKGINGASCLIYPDVIKNLAEELDSDLYILPSSIHEIIILKGTHNMDKNIFREMVIDINRTQVPEEDILSDNVYFYSRERNAITM